MKKLMAGLSALIVLLAIIACGGNGSGEEGGTSAMRIYKVVVYEGSIAANTFNRLFAYAAEGDLLNTQEAEFNEDGTVSRINNYESGVIASWYSFTYNSDGTIATKDGHDDMYPVEWNTQVVYEYKSGLLVKQSLYDRYDGGSTKVARDLETTVEYSYNTDDLMTSAIMKGDDGVTVAASRTFQYDADKKLVRSGWTISTWTATFLYYYTDTTITAYMYGKADPDPMVDAPAWIRITTIDPAEGLIITEKTDIDGNGSIDHCREFKYLRTEGSTENNDWYEAYIKKESRLWVPNQL